MRLAFLAGSIVTHYLPDHITVGGGIITGNLYKCIYNGDLSLILCGVSGQVLCMTVRRVTCVMSNIPISRPL